MTDIQIHVISRRSNGDVLYGLELPLAVDLFARGTPPVWGLASKPPPSSRIASVKVGDCLKVKRVDKQWVAYDDVGVIGALRWRPGDDGKTHAVTGVKVRLPETGTLHVTQYLERAGKVVDIGGYVEPSD